MKKLFFLGIVVSIYGGSWCTEGNSTLSWWYANLTVHAARLYDCQGLKIYFDIWERAKEERANVARPSKAVFGRK